MWYLGDDKDDDDSDSTGGEGDSHWICTLWCCIGEKIDLR